MSLQRFSRFTKAIGFTYANVKRDVNNSDQMKIKRIQCAIDMIEMYRMKNVHILSFDVTSINSKSFKKMNWQMKNCQKGHKNIFYYNATHILMLISLEGIESFFIIRGNMSADLITHFLDTALKKFKEKSNQHLPIKLILDNATMHKTLVMKQMILHHDINVIFPPPCNPYLNPIEFIFKFIKQPLKSKFSML
jgi:transposase